MSASDDYTFVPLPPSVHRESRPQARFDHRVAGTITVVLQVTLEVRQPIHIGAGHWALRNGYAARAAVRSSDRPVIPGSSLKGVIRARYEAITKSCCMGHRAPRSRTLGRNLPSQNFSNHTVTFDDAIGRHEVFSPCTPSRMCSSCALFGLMSQRSRVAVHDMVAPEGTRFEDKRIPERFSPRPHHLGKFEVDRDARRIDVKKLWGRKFYLGTTPRLNNSNSTEWVEVIPQGTQLMGRIVGTNLTPAELGGLLSAMGCDPPSQMKIGSGKAYAFGQFEVAGLGVYIRWPQAGHERLFAGLRSSFKGSPDYHQAGEHRLISIHGGTPS